MKNLITFLLLSASLLSEEAYSQEYFTSYSLTTSGEVLDNTLVLGKEINKKTAVSIGYRKFDDLWTSEDYIPNMNPNSIGVFVTLNTLEIGKTKLDLTAGYYSYAKNYQNWNEWKGAPTIGASIGYKIHEKIIIESQINIIGFNESSPSNENPYPSYWHKELAIIQIRYNLN